MTDQLVSDCDDLDAFVVKAIKHDPKFARALLVEALAAEMHRDSDHGKDGHHFGERLCNCRQKAASAARALTGARGPSGTVYCGADEPVWVLR